MSMSESPNVMQILKEASAEKLFQILRLIDGKKDLVLDKEIICFLDYIANFTLLKEYNVEKVFKLETGPSPGQNQKCVYVIKPKIQNAQIISDHINANLSIGTEKLYWVIYVSRKILTVSVLSIVSTAPLEAVLTSFLGPILLSKDTSASEISVNEQETETEVKRPPLNYGSCHQLQPSDILPPKSEQ